MASREVVDFEFPAPVVMEYRMVGRAYWRQALLDSAVVSLVVVAAALALPGVVAVWTGEDVATIPPIPFRATKLKGLEPYCQPILARGRVRYVGEPVAVVFAEDAALAEDAADLAAFLATFGPTATN